MSESRKEWLEDLRISIENAFKEKYEPNVEDSDEDVEQLNDATK